MEKKNKVIFASVLISVLLSSVFSLSEQHLTPFGWHDTYQIDQVNHCLVVSPCFIAPQASLTTQTVLIDPAQAAIGSVPVASAFEIFSVLKSINNKSPPLSVS